MKGKGQNGFRNIKKGWWEKRRTEAKMFFNKRMNNRTKKMKT